MKVNSKTGLCSSLSEGQHVCCSQGKLPDLRPKEGADGYCAVYTTKEEDYCSKIAASLMLTVDELESFNKNTWGWNGCKLLYPKFNMCVSKGAAPMPAIVPVSENFLFEYNYFQLNIKCTNTVFPYTERGVWTDHERHRPTCRWNQH